MLCVCTVYHLPAGGGRGSRLGKGAARRGLVLVVMVVCRMQAAGQQREERIHTEAKDEKTIPRGSVLFLLLFSL